MTSAEHAAVLRRRITSFLRELGIDESHAAVVQALLVRAPAARRATVTAVAAPMGRERAGDLPGSASEAATGIAPTMLFESEQTPSREPVASSPSFGVGAEKLAIISLLGEGGMGEVFRVHDGSLHRALAMKVLLPNIAEQDMLESRFIAEAQVTAQLAHPGIPPVHEIGALGDGRPYFTMKEVHGVTLADVIDEANAQTANSRWNEQRLLEIFQRACEAVAYAHARGVVHCDLKPANVMVGAFGEVLVMDWGVARLVPASRSMMTHEPAVTVGSSGIIPDAVAGTPAYMAPEQASAMFEQIGPRSDVYALGLILFELLAGRRPFVGSVAPRGAATIPPLVRRGGRAVDDALHAIVTRAMAPDPEARYPDAKALADDLALWRDGAMRREKALATVRQGQAMIPEIEPALADAAELHERAARELASLGPDAPVEAKEPAWALLDRAAQLAQEALLRQVEVEQLLFNALAYTPDLEEAKALIARLRFRRHQDAERRRAWEEAAGHELVMRANDTGEFRQYLEGRALLSVETRPRAKGRLYRIVRRTKRLVPDLVGELGETPLTDIDLPVGSYLLELSAEGHAPVRYPVVLRRSEGWASRRPGEQTLFAVPLPRAEEIEAGEVWVAAGAADLGGDELAPGAHRAERVWVDGFVIREHPVTYAELARFLADEEGASFRSQVFRDGLEVWRPDWPAVGLSWAAAKAYAGWVARKTGKPWRLPTEIEWEKAARGVDGRFYPWGDSADPAFAHARTVERSAPTPVPVGAFPADISPYGVRGMGGNVRDWCEDAAGLDAYATSHGIAAVPVFAPDAPLRIVRGGSWRQAPEAARVAARAALVAANGYPDVGVRLVRSL